MKRNLINLVAIILITVGTAGCSISIERQTDIGFTENIFAEEAYQRKSISYINTLWPATPEARKISSAEAEELLSNIKKNIKKEMEMERFDYNPLPDNLVQEFAMEAKKKETLTMEKAAELLNATVVPTIIKVLNESVEVRAKELISEEERNSFIAVKAKELGLTAEHFEKILNSAYMYLPVLTGYSRESVTKKEKTKEGKTITKESIKCTLEGGIVWFRLKVSDGKGNVEVVAYVKGKGVGSASDAAKSPKKTSKVVEALEKISKTAEALEKRGEAVEKQMTVKEKVLTELIFPGLLEQSTKDERVKQSSKDKKVKQKTKDERAFTKKTKDERAFYSAVFSFVLDLQMQMATLAYPGMEMGPAQRVSFRLRGRVLECSGDKVGFNLGKKEGLFIDQRFKVYEVMEDKHGNRKLKDMGFFMVRHVGDNISNRNALSYGKPINGRYKPGMLIEEYPRIPVDLLGYITVVGKERMVGAAGRVNMAEDTGIPQFFMTMGVGASMEEIIGYFGVMKKYYFKGLAFVSELRGGYCRREVYGSVEKKPLFSMNVGLEMALTANLDFGIMADSRRLGWIYIGY